MSDRPNLLALSLSAAVAIVSGLGLVLTLLGRPIPWGFMACLFLFAAAWPSAWAMSRRERDAAAYSEAITAGQELANAERQAKLEAPVPAPPPVDYTPAWHLAVRRFVQAGEWHGFDVRILAADRSPHKVTTYDGWGALRDVLVAGGWLRGANYTRWAVGRSYAAWNAERGWEGLTYPPTPAPDVDFPIQAPLQRHPTTEDGPDDGGAGEAEPGPAVVADAAGRERALRALVGAGRKG